MLRQYIDEKLGLLKGHTGVYYKNLITGETLLTKGEDQFLAASVIKIWVMAEAFYQIREGKIKREQKILLCDSDKIPEGGMPDYLAQKKQGVLSDDMFPESGVLNYLHSGIPFTVEDLYKLMIVISDNTATNMLIRLLGIDKINEFIASLHMSKTRLNRLLFDTSKEKENTISLEEAGIFLEKIYRGEMISPEASREMCAILQNQQANFKIPFFLPQIPIAHKTGEDNGITNDVGIVYGEVPFILCFAANDADVPSANQACQEIARAAYRYSLGMERLSES
ncbi:serine hydrolase [Aminipila luticellarii]|uniref:Serine hydrolase n=1 Tax=Aminipila luticellarii TaxID=2507160 RepID=A0A410PU96_9FIRM|nr:serine hydrolase [Aminipila luticellarii]QAT42448.1 serine hydrolase [Aminipila luticellarii]